jgi:hypothetical protein
METETEMRKSTTKDIPPVQPLLMEVLLAQDVLPLVYL